MIDFFDLSYLAKGSSIQRKGYRAITASGIMETLKEFDPVVVGTLPLDLFIDTSDIDIICFCSNPGKFGDFTKKELGGVPSFVKTFQCEGFMFEIVAQPIPVREQLAFRHLVAEWKILAEKGDSFRQKILELKRSGIKTEPAFAQMLGLKGDPYQAVLTTTNS